MNGENVKKGELSQDNNLENGSKDIKVIEMSNHVT